MEIEVEGIPSASLRASSTDRARRELRLPTGWKVTSDGSGFDPSGLSPSGRSLEGIKRLVQNTRAYYLLRPGEGGWKVVGYLSPRPPEGS